MAIKHVLEYYDEVCKQRQEMINEIKDFEEEAAKGLIEPERLDKIKENIQPLMNNYQTISWIMFLLNKPVNKKKHKNYEKQKSKEISKLDTKYSKEGIIDENKKVLETLNKTIKGLN